MTHSTREGAQRFQSTRDAARADITAGFRQGRQHEPFQTVERYEQLIAMRTDNPAAYEQLGNSTHIALGLYESEKARATQPPSGDDAA